MQAHGVRTCVLCAVHLRAVRPPVRASCVLCTRVPCVPRALWSHEPAPALLSWLLALDPVHFRVCCLGASAKLASGTHHRHCALAWPQVLQDGAGDRALGALGRVGGRSPSAWQAVLALYVCWAAKHVGCGWVGSSAVRRLRLWELCRAVMSVLQRRKLRVGKCNLSLAARLLSGSSPSLGLEASVQQHDARPPPRIHTGGPVRPLFTRWGFLGCARTGQDPGRQ